LEDYRQDPKRLLPKPLSFTTAIGQKRRVIENYPKDRTESLTTEEAQKNHKSGEMNGIKKE